MSSSSRLGAWFLSLWWIACATPATPGSREPVPEAAAAACMPAPSPTAIAEPSLDLAHLLPTTQRIERGERVARVGNVEVPVMSGFPAIVERRPVPVIGWRPTAVDAVLVPPIALDDWRTLVAASLEVGEIDRRAPLAVADRETCSDDACKRCLKEESVALATGRASAVDAVLGASERLDRKLRASSPDDGAAQLVWASSLEMRAAAVEAPIERATLLAEALFTFERAGRRAEGAARAWLLYGAARVADAIGDDAHVAGVRDRGAVLVRSLVADVLEASPVPWMRVEALYRVTRSVSREAVRSGTIRDTSMLSDITPPGDTFDAATLRGAATLSTLADEALSKAQAGLRIAWARAAVREGRSEEAIAALVPLWRRADRAAFTADAEPVLVDALERLARSARPTLGLVDVDTFARVALELGARAAMHFDPELARTAWTALRAEARDTLAYPGALRGLTILARDDEHEARRLRGELVALGERDAGGQVASEWSRAVRARSPSIDATRLDEAVRDATVAVRLSHSRESNAKARILALASECHAGAAKGPPLELEIDALGATRVLGDGDWGYTSPEDLPRSLRACLVERGPDYFRTFGRPVTATIHPKLRKPRR